MLISKKLNDAINDEIGRELFAANMYTNVAAYFDGLALKKLGEMFFKQGADERDHADKFVRYLCEVGGNVVVPAIDAPQAKFSSAEAAVQLALDWEMEITRRINDLMTLAVSQKDYAAQDFLRWFVTEQVEEVSTMENLLKVVKHAGERNIIMAEAYLVHSG